MTEQERWTKLVADFETSDMMQRECAAQRGISFSNLRIWIYMATQGVPAAVGAAERVWCRFAW